MFGRLKLLVVANLVGAVVLGSMLAKSAGAEDESGIGCCKLGTSLELYCCVDCCANTYNCHSTKQCRQEQ